MHLSGKIKRQLAAFILIALIFVSYVLISYVNLPYLLFNAGHYTVTLQSTDTGGLYQRSNVTYQGRTIGEVSNITLGDNNITARLSLQSGIDIPSDVRAEIHSQSAIGEQYVELVGGTATAPPLASGDTIPESRTRVPPTISALLDKTDTALAAIPRDNLQTVVDESATAFGGLGPDLARMVKGATTLAIDARHNLDAITTVIDQSGPILESQAATSDAINRWAANVDTLTSQLRERNTAFQGLLQNGADAAGQARQLIDRVQPTLPLLLANLVSISQVALTYRADLEQLLVLLPQSIANTQGTGVASRHTPPGPYRTGFLSFNLNINLPPPCTTGYLPPQSKRSPSEVNFPDRPSGDLYCRIPQDAPFNVRGVRNIPCETKPWKRAPTVAMCESDQQYVPLNDGVNWKGDPNATLSGQDIPQPRPPDTITLPQPPAAVPQPGPPPVAVVPYDPATGQYVGPDGKPYTRTDLNKRGPTTWQSLLVPPA